MALYKPAPSKSWRILDFFKQINQNKADLYRCKEIDMLLDVVTLSRPATLAEGFKLHKSTRNGPVVTIRSLSQLEVRFHFP